LLGEEKAMIYGQVELHNIEEVIKVPDREGVLLQRVPEIVQKKLRQGTQQQYKKPAGSEIRFVSDSEPVKITLASYGGQSKACLYFGGFQGPEYFITEEPITVEIATPEMLSRYIDISGESNYFSPRVKRLILYGNEVHLIRVEGANIRPPKKEEVPGYRYLAYGTSITQGINASLPTLSFVQQAAWRLKADAINLGASGNAFCEEDLADYITGRQDWDFATLCISVNMLNQGVSGEEFYNKASYMINTIAENNPSKPVVCISLFPYHMDKNLKHPDKFPVSTTEEYRNIVKTIVEKADLPNLYYVDGRDLLKDFSGLSADLLHPGNLGMIQIGENLAKFIGSIL
jgi:lysophospholipase L1-like esterase